MGFPKKKGDSYDCTKHHPPPNRFLNKQKSDHSIA